MLTMRSELMHSWRVDHVECDSIQRRLAAEVVLWPLAVDGPESPSHVAGVDVAYSKQDDLAWAVAVVMNRRFKVLSTSVAEGRPDVTYAPGYLAFREGRLTLAALAGLEVPPDLVFLDGHGVVHERGLGLASHIGVLLDIPTIGAPKTPFHAIYHDPGRGRGEYYVLTKEWGAQGASIRLKASAKPVYVSPGHLVDLESALALAVMWSSGRHRVPEPLSAAHTLSSEARNGASL
jgi:deoxyribonuclease V